MVNFTKMDRIWVATALLLHPQTNISILVTSEEIITEINRCFPTEITHVMLTRHLVSCVDRQADKAYPKQGGSRNRYLYRTLDGQQPSETGLYRLYKIIDSPHDGWDKTGKVHPKSNDIPKEFRYLIAWYMKDYYEG